MSDVLRRPAAPPLLRALAGRAFALLWGGQALSRLGDGLFQVALAWWVLERSGSATAMASLLIAGLAPTLLLLLLGGVAGDRYPPVALMLGADLLRGALVCVVAALAALGLLQLWHLYLLNLALGAVEAFFLPAYAAALPALVAEDDLPSANALTSASAQLSRIAGPALGAACVAWGGVGLAFALNGLSFLAAAALLAPLLGRPPALRRAPGEPRPSLRAEVWAGLRTVLATPWLWATILAFAVGNVALGGPYGVALPFLVDARFGADVGALGLLYTLFAAGYLLGGLAVGQLRRLRWRGRLIYGALAAAGLALGAFALPLPLLALGALALLNGAALEAGGLAWTSALQQLVPREQLGRVSSIDALGSYALVPLGYAAAGWATDLFGAPLVFAAGGGLAAAVAALVFAGLPAVRALD